MIAFKFAKLNNKNKKENYLNVDYRVFYFMDMTTWITNLISVGNKMKLYEIG